MPFEGSQDRTRRSPSTECPRFAPGYFQKVPRGLTARACNPNFMLDLISSVPNTAFFSHLFLLHLFCCCEHIHSLYFISTAHLSSRAGPHHLANYIKLQIYNLYLSTTSQDNFDSLSIPQCGFHLATPRYQYQIRLF